MGIRLIPFVMRKEGKETETEVNKEEKEERNGTERNGKERKESGREATNTTSAHG